MKAHGERIVIFGDSLSHPGADDGPTQSLVTLGSSRFSSAPGDLMGSMLLEAGAEAVMIDARVGRSATNYWRREDTSSLMATIAEFRPTMAVVMLGTNDLNMNKDVEKTSFEAIRDTLKTAGAREVWAIGPMTYQAPNEDYNAKAGAMLDLMRGVFGGGYTLDARPLTTSAARSRDGVHFTTTGAREAATALTRALLAKNPKAALFGWIAGGLGVLAAILIGYKLAKRGGDVLGDGSGRLALPPAPGENIADWGSVIHDALEEGNTERADELLAELNEDQRAVLRKLPANAMWTVNDEKDWDPHDAIRDLFDRRFNSEESALAQLTEDVDEYRDHWIEQYSEDVIAEGGIPAIAWENFRAGAIASSTAEYRRQVAERAEYDEDLDGTKAGDEMSSEPSELWGKREELAASGKDIRFSELLRDPDPAAMDIAEDWLRERGETIRANTGGMRARNFTIELTPMWAPSNEWRNVQVSVERGSAYIWHKTSIAVGNARFSADGKEMVSSNGDAELDMIKRQEMAKAWWIAREIRSLPLDTKREQLEAIYNESRSKGDEIVYLYGDLAG